jgi:signal peptidase I
MRYLNGTLIFVFILLLIGCKGFVYRNVSAGMAPTLNVDDTFTINPYAYSNRPVERFDIIVFDASRNTPRGKPEAPWIKRVIGLPGETVEMRNGKVFINGQLLEEPFQKIDGEPGTAWKTDFSPTIVPDNQYFVLGDNRPNSEDSRYFNPPTISLDKIRGKLLDIYPSPNKKS